MNDGTPVYYRESRCKNCDRKIYSINEEEWIHATSPEKMCFEHDRKPIGHPRGFYIGSAPRSCGNCNELIMRPSFQHSWKHVRTGRYTCDVETKQYVEPSDKITVVKGNPAALSK